MSDPYRAQTYRPSAEDQQRALHETGMQTWLHAKAEEDKRKQEEEKTQQEMLRLEQRHIEISMLRQCIDNGIPPTMIPMVFSAFKGLPGGQPNLGQQEVQPPREWPRDLPTMNNNPELPPSSNSGSLQQRVWNPRYHTSFNAHSPATAMGISHSRPPEPPANSNPVQPPTIDLTGFQHKRQHTLPNVQSVPINNPRTSTISQRLDTGRPPPQPPISPAQLTQTQPPPVNYPTPQQDPNRDTVQQRSMQYTFPRPNDQPKPNDSSRAPSRSPEPEPSSTQAQPAPARPVAFNFYTPPVTRSLAFSFYTPPVKPTAESSRTPPSKKIRHVRETSNLDRTETLSPSADQRPKSPSPGLAHEPGIAVPESPPPPPEPQGPSRLEQFRSWVEATPKPHFTRKRARST